MLDRPKLWTKLREVVQNQSDNGQSGDEKWARAAVSREMRHELKRELNSKHTLESTRWGTKSRRYNKEITTKTKLSIKKTGKQETWWVSSQWTCSRW